MAKDLVTNLTINTQGFSSGLNRAKRELKAFDKNIGGVGSKVGGTLVGTFTKFAGAAGLAMGAVELLSTAIKSNSKFNNELTDTLESCKTAIGDFFNALATGDWSVFEDGIDRAIKKGKDYLATMRNIKTSLKIGNNEADYWESLSDEKEHFITDKKVPSSKRREAMESYVSDRQRAVNITGKNYQKPYLQKI